MDCVLCCYHPDNKEEKALFVINGLSVCELHADWIMKKIKTVPQYSGYMQYMMEELNNKPLTDIILKD